MSFGKDKQHLDAIPVYGGSTQQRAANAGRKRQRNYGNRKAYWMDTFRPSETHPTSVRLIPGEFEVKKVDGEQVLIEKLPWYEFVEHYSGRHQRGAICSGGPWFFRKDRRDPCYGCDQRESETKDNRTMSRSDKFAFIAIDLGLFHQVQQVDRQTGQIKVNPKTHEPYLEWVKCAGRGCQNCHMAIQSRYGHIQPWTMPKAHFKALNAYAANIGLNCVTCRGRGTIQSLSWHCGNPQCQALFFDMNTTSFTDEQIAEVVNDVVTCQTCQHVAYPKEVITCLNCSPNGWQPVRASIFDVDLQVQAPRTGENNSTVLQIVGMTDPKPLDPVYQDLLQYKPNLSQRFAPSALEYQAELWKVSAPAGAQNAQPPGQYGQPGAPLPAASYTVPYGQAPVQQPMGPPMPQHPQQYQQPQYPPPQPSYPPPQTTQPQYPPAPTGYPNYNGQPQQPQQPAPQYPNQPQPYTPQPPTTPPGGYTPTYGGYNPQGGYNQ